MVVEEFAVKSRLYRKAPKTQIAFMGDSLNSALALMCQAQGRQGAQASDHRQEGRGP